MVLVVGLGFSAAMDTSASGSGSGSKEMEEMMRNLGITEEDLDDVVFEEEGTPTVEATRWMAVARVDTQKPYSQYWFFRTMRAAWDLAQEVKIRPLEDNLYTLQFSCLGDWERVMEEGPWNFKGNAVILAEYDGYTKPSEVKLDSVEIWIQIHDLPGGYYSMIKSLAGKVGEYIYAEPSSHDFEGNFYRVRVRINVEKPLKNAVSVVKGGKRQFFLVKYERLPDWCAVCGHLGHQFKEHGDGVHPPQALVFKNLGASWFRGAGRGPGEGRGRGRSGRGRGQGRGAGQRSAGTDAGYNTHEEVDSDLIMEDVDANRKRTATHETAPVAAKTAITQSGGGVLALPPPAIPPSPPPKQDPKRTKTENGSDKDGRKKTLQQNKTPDARSAASMMEDRRAQ